EDTFYLIEKEPLVNKFISVPHEKGGFNPAYFNAGIIEGFIRGANFPGRVSAHWHKGVAYKVVFDNWVVEKDIKY
ncbi:hypothetical protein, partial [Salmonella sp. s51228]|uniref:hypothetical protein n=1 Tax=Salmonella sp. s51228 TaxID=3159652 RepID=UPI003980153D